MLWGMTVRRAKIEESGRISAPGDTLDPLEVLDGLIGRAGVFWESDKEPLRIARGELRTEAVRQPSGSIALRIAACSLVAGGDVKSYRTPRGLVLVDSVARLVIVARVGAGQASLVEGLRALPREFPAETEDQLLERLHRMEERLPVVLPSDLAWQETSADARLRLLLTPVKAGGLTVSLGVRPAVGGSELFAPGEGPAVLTATLVGARRRVRRELQAEAEAGLRIATELGLDERSEGPPWTWGIPDDQDALDLVVSLQANPRSDLVVEWPEDGSRLLVARAATTNDLRLRIVEGRDWFGLDGEVDLDGDLVPLAELLAALRTGRRYVPISAGKWFVLTARLRERIQDLVDAAQGGGERGGLELGPAAAPFVDEIILEAGTFEACKAWAEMKQRFDATMALCPEPPTTLTAELRDYQLEGYRWLSRLAAWGVGGCLADDMGLGKTVQALAALIDRAPLGPALIVAPTSVGANWVRECRKFCPTLNPVLYRETDRLPEPDRFRPGDLVVTSYGLLLRDVEKLAKVGWGTLVLDEAQFVKNSRSKTATAVR